MEISGMITPTTNMLLGEQLMVLVTLALTITAILLAGEVFKIISTTQMDIHKEILIMEEINTSTLITQSYPLPGESCTIARTILPSRIPRTLPMDKVDTPTMATLGPLLPLAVGVGKFRQFEANRWLRILYELLLITIFL